MPKQTFDMLRRLHFQGHKIVIATYNPLVVLIVNRMGLSKYVKDVISGTECRHSLLFKHLKDYKAKFIYVDDRSDNIKKHYLHHETNHVTDPLKLYTLL